MIFTYPLQLFVFRDTFLKQFFKGQPFNRIRHTVITVLVVASTVMVGCLTCDLGIILEITGGVTGSLVALVIPCACYLKVNQINGVVLTTKEKIPHVICMSLGACLMIMTVVTQIMKAAQGGGKEVDCKWGSW